MNPSEPLPTSLGNEQTTIKRCAGPSSILVGGIRVSPLLDSCDLRTCTPTPTMPLIDLFATYRPTLTAQLGNVERMVRVQTAQAQVRPRGALFDVREAWVRKYLPKWPAATRSPAGEPVSTYCGVDGYPFTPTTCPSMMLADNRRLRDKATSVRFISRVL